MAKLSTEQIRPLIAAEALKQYPDLEGAHKASAWKRTNKSKVNGNWQRLFSAGFMEAAVVSDSSDAQVISITLHIKKAGDSDNSTASAKLKKKYVFAIDDSSEMAQESVSGFYVYITPKDVWEDCGYMDDQGGCFGEPILEDNFIDAMEGVFEPLNSSMTKEQAVKLLKDAGAESSAKFVAFIKNSTEED